VTIFTRQSPSSSSGGVGDKDVVGCLQGQRGLALRPVSNRRARRDDLAPSDDTKFPVERLDQCCQAFDPVAAVAIQETVDVADFGVMDVAAQHAVVAVAARLARQYLLEAADEADGVLHLVLQVGRQRPIAEAEPCAQRIQVAVEPQCEVIELIADVGEPLGVQDHAIGEVAVHDPETAAVGEPVLRLVAQRDAAEVQPGELAAELVVVAEHIDDTSALARLAQDLLHDVVVRLRPVEAVAHRQPSITSPTRYSTSDSLWRRKSSRYSALQPRVPRCTSEMKIAR